MSAQPLGRGKGVVAVCPVFPDRSKTSAQSILMRTLSYRMPDTTPPAATPEMAGKGLRKAASSQQSYTLRRLPNMGAVTALGSNPNASLLWKGCQSRIKFLDIFFIPSRS